MRSVVVSYSRPRLAHKRGGDLQHRVTDLPEDLEGELRFDEDMLALHIALTKPSTICSARLSNCAISPVCPNLRSLRC